MYYLIQDLNDPNAPYFYSDAVDWSRWHSSVQNALSAKLEYSMSATIESILKSNTRYTVLFKSETPILAKDHPELLV